MSFLNSFFHTIMHEWGSLTPVDRELSRFGFFVGGIFFLIGGWFALENSFWLLLLAVGAVLVFGALTVPRVLLLPCKVWIMLGVILGLVVSPIVLIVLFYGLITPIGLLQRVFGSDALSRRMHGARISYWEKREPEKKEHMRKPF